MRKGNLLFSAVQGLFALLVLLVGFFFIGLHYAPYLRLHLSVFFANPSFSFLGIGSVVCVSGMLLLMGFCAMYKGRYYQVKMGGRRVAVDPALIEQLVQAYWQETFPQHEISLQVLVSRSQKLEILLSLPPLARKEQQALLAKAEPGLKKIFFSQLGYEKEFTVSVLLK